MLLSVMRPPRVSEQPGSVLTQFFFFSSFLPAAARAIQDQLLKDFASKPEFSDWFSREEVPKKPAIIKPNPKNIELEQKIAELEHRVHR